MNKKIVIVVVITLMLVMTNPLNVLGGRVKDDNLGLFLGKGINEDKIVGKNTFLDESSNADDFHETVVINHSIHFLGGWIRVNSTGKGLHLIVPLRLLRVNVPIPTPQYYNFFPFKIDIFVTLLVYNDSNAVTKITIKNRTSGGYDTFNIHGSHSLVVGMFKIPTIGPWRNLLKRGLIDGVNPVQQFFNGKPKLNFIAKILPANILRQMRDKTFGGPIIDISKSTDSFLRGVGGVVPRYDGSTRIFNLTLLEKLGEYFPNLASIPATFPNLANLASMIAFQIAFQLRYLVILSSGEFWNKRSLRSSVLQLRIPQQLMGYTPFVIWNDKPRLGSKLVGCLQNRKVFDLLYEEGIKLISPKGSENLSGIVPVKWFATGIEYLDGEKLPINLCYSANDGKTWRQIGGTLKNTGKFLWDTSTLSAGKYKLRVSAEDNDNSVGYDESETFMVNSNNTGAMVSDVRIVDTNIDSYDWVKNGDTVNVTASITGVTSITGVIDNITADLTGFGGSKSAHPTRLDGFIVKWTLPNVECHPSDYNDLIYVNVTLNMRHLQRSRVGSITADNINPRLSVGGLAHGVYFFNHRLPLNIVKSTIIIGPVTIQIDADDNLDISKIEFFIDDKSEPVDVITKELPKRYFDGDWYMNYKLLGDHNLKVVAYDCAGNMQNVLKEIRVYNFLGK